MTDFVVLENIALFNRLLTSERDPTKRRTILRLLAQEIEKLPDDGHRRAACSHLRMLESDGRPKFSPP